MSDKAPKPRIGLDIDGVLYRFDDTFRYLARWKFGVTVPESDYWDSIKDHLTHDQWMWMWSAGITKHGLFRHGSIYKGAIHGVQDLAKLGRVELITKRPEQAFQDTIDWLSFHRLPVENLHYITAGSKSQVACDVYIDDSIENTTDLIHNTTGLVLLWDRPWNQTGGEYSHRVDNWEQVYDAITFRSKQLEPSTAQRI